jgi:hypothetical protein
LVYHDGFSLLYNVVTPSVPVHSSAEYIAEAVELFSIECVVCDSVALPKFVEAKKTAPGLRLIVSVDPTDAPVSAPGQDNILEK